MVVSAVTGTVDRIIRSFEQNVIIMKVFQNIAVLTFCVMVVLNVGCQQKKDSSAEAGEPVDSDEIGLLKKEVMAIHDEVMPKMNDMYKLKSSLKEKLSDSAAAPTAKTDMASAVNKLDSAHNGMMRWMRQYHMQADSVDSSEMTQEERRAFYEQEMERIRRVREDMLDAIEKAQKLTGGK